MFVLHHSQQLFSGRQTRFAETFCNGFGGAKCAFVLHTQVGANTVRVTLHINCAYFVTHVCTTKKFMAKVTALMHASLDAGRRNCMNSFALFRRVMKSFRVTEVVRMSM
jgi:hypothetical protein